MNASKWFLYPIALLFIFWASATAQAQPFAYITNNVDHTVSVVDTATNTITQTIPVGLGPMGVAVSLDGSRVYVTNFDDNTVSVIDGVTNLTVTTVLVGRKPIGVAVNSE